MECPKIVSAVAEGRDYGGKMGSDPNRLKWALTPITADKQKRALTPINVTQ